MALEAELVGRALPPVPRLRVEADRLRDRARLRRVVQSKYVLLTAAFMLGWGALEFVTDGSAASTMVWLTVLALLSLGLVSRVGFQLHEARKASADADRALARAQTAAIDARIARLAPPIRVASNAASSSDDIADEEAPTNAAPLRGSVR